MLWDILHIIIFACFEISDCGERENMPFKLQLSLSFVNDRSQICNLLLFFSGREMFPNCELIKVDHVFLGC